ncbi:hypothetical protein CW309_13620 [Pseudomonas hunanensis]|nr:hypothetical protein CW309_13620 [Pseudomonas hunanensis]
MRFEDVLPGGGTNFSEFFFRPYVFLKKNNPGMILLIVRISMRQRSAQLKPLTWVIQTAGIHSYLPPIAHRDVQKNV